jgi:hypothetical protein
MILSDDKLFKEIEDHPFIRHAQEDTADNSVRVPPNKAVFYSGPGQYRAAQQFCRIQNKILQGRGETDFYQTLHDTPGGKTLNKMWFATSNEEIARLGGKTFANDQALQEYADQVRLGATRIYSSRYAESVEGNVATFTHGANADGFFRSIELPHLINSQAVPTIDGINKKEWRETARNKWVATTCEHFTESDSLQTSQKAISPEYKRAIVSLGIELTENYQTLEKTRSKRFYDSQADTQFQNANARLDHLAATVSKHPDVLENISDDARLREDMHKRVQRLEKEKQPGVMKHHQLEVDT